MNTLTIALAQIDLVLGSPARNLESARAKITDATTRGADVVVLPELWSSAYDLEHATTHASALDTGMFAELGALARENQIAIVGSLLELDGSHVFNTATLVDMRGQRIGAYRKLHLVPMLDEDKFLAGGDNAPVFDASSGKCALAVCSDLRFPELWRHYALIGARSSPRAPSKTKFLSRRRTALVQVKVKRLADIRWSLTPGARFWLKATNARRC